MSSPGFLPVYMEGDLCGLVIHGWSRELYFLLVECDLYFRPAINIFPLNRNWDNAHFIPKHLEADHLTFEMGEGGRGYGLGFFL